MNFNSELYRKLKETMGHKGGTEAMPKCTATTEELGESDDHESKTAEEEEECGYDELFYSKLEHLQRVIIDLFAKYRLRYCASKSIEFAVSQCRDEYLSISAAQTQKMRELELFRDSAAQRSKAESDGLESRAQSERASNALLIKQLKFKYEKALKKVAERTREETTRELEKHFSETVKSRARKSLAQLRDGQQKTVKSLQKKVLWLQSEVQRLDGQRNLMETKRELHSEESKSQLSALKTSHAEAQRSADARIKASKEEMREMKKEMRAMATQKTESAEETEHLRGELRAKDSELTTLKERVRAQLREITLNMNGVEKEHGEKMAEKQREHEKLMSECQQRMTAVLEKKKAQNQRLKRLLEKTVTEYEKEKAQTQTMLNLRNEQLKELTNELQI